jgi:hypothetical protein
MQRLVRSRMAYGNAVKMGFKNVFIRTSNAKIVKLSLLPNNCGYHKPD